MLTSLLPDLDVVDYLELFNSTVRVSELLGVSQSTCSRRYRSLSDELVLKFDRVDGSYQAAANHDVLQLFRQAAQRLRLRRQLLRYALAPCCPDLHTASVLPPPLPLQLTDTSRMLGLLDQRLLDLWFGGLLEISGLVAEPLCQLRSGRMQLSPSVHAIPLVRWRLQLVARRDHPLVGRTDLRPIDLAAYPSPAFSLGAAPQLVSQLQSHGLASQTRSPRDGDPEGWRACNRDGRSLAYAPPHLLPQLAREYQLLPLHYDLGIHEVAALIGHREVLLDPAFPPLFRLLVEALQTASGASHPALEWLS
jgi:hypothetical protein